MNAISYNMKTAVAATGLSRSRLFIAMASGELPYLHTGRARLILANDLINFVHNYPAGDPAVDARNLVARAASGEG